MVGRKLPNSEIINDRPYHIKRFRLLFHKGPFFYAAYNFRLFFFLLFRKSDCLLANDLDTLPANYLAKKFKRKVKLFYDSHEYFTGVPELISRPKIQNIWKRIEKKCLPSVDVFYTVNDSIADLYRKEYQKEIHVVRNIGDLPEINQPKSREELGLPKDKKIVLLQGAGININRGAEELVEAMSLINNVVLIIVGDGDVVPQLKRTVKEKDLSQRVLFFGKRPYHELLNFTLVSDIGVSLDKPTGLNYLYSLPNKLFDYIHCHLPVVVSDLPEVKKIVSHYKLGLIIPSHNPDDIANTLNKILNDENLYQTLKKNTFRASTELTWSNERKVLEKLYL